MTFHRQILSLLSFAAFSSAVLTLNGCATDSNERAGSQSAAALTSADSAGQGGPSAHARHRGHPGDAFFAKFDQDGDGKIALADIPEPMRQRMEKADQDHDGYVTRSELKEAGKAFREEMKKRADKNGDGVVSEEERAEMREEMMKEHFAAKDKNHDGAWSSEEISAKHFEYLKVADTNGDGKITLDELIAAQKNGTLKPPSREARGDLKKHADKDGDGVVSEEERAEMMKEHFAAKDKNHDGAWTVDEVSPKRWEHLKVADTNGDGKITLDELVAAHKNGALPAPKHGSPRPQ